MPSLMRASHLCGPAYTKTSSSAGSRRIDLMSRFRGRCNTRYILTPDAITPLAVLVSHRISKISAPFAAGELNRFLDLPEYVQVSATIAGMNLLESTRAFKIQTLSDILA